MTNKGALMEIFIYQALNVLCYDLRETKEKEKDAGRVLDRENMADVLEQRHPVCRVFVTD